MLVESFSPQTGARNSSRQECVWKRATEHRCGSVVGWKENWFIELSAQPPPVLGWCLQFPSWCPESSTLLRHKDIRHRHTAVACRHMLSTLVHQDVLHLRPRDRCGHARRLDCPPSLCSIMVRASRISGVLRSLRVASSSCWSAGPQYCHSRPDTPLSTRHRESWTAAPTVWK